MGNSLRQQGTNSGKEAKSDEEPKTSGASSHDRYVTRENLGESGSVTGNKTFNTYQRSESLQRRPETNISVGKNLNLEGQSIAYYGDYSFHRGNVPEHLQGPPVPQPPQYSMHPRPPQGPPVPQPPQYSMHPQLPQGPPVPQPPQYSMNPQLPQGPPVPQPPQYSMHPQLPQEPPVPQPPQYSMHPQLPQEPPVPQPPQYSMHPQLPQGPPVPQPPQYYMHPQPPQGPQYSKQPQHPSVSKPHKAKKASQNPPVAQQVPPVAKAPLAKASQNPPVAQQVPPVAKAPLAKAPQNPPVAQQVPPVAKAPLAKAPQNPPVSKKKKASQKPPVAQQVPPVPKAPLAKAPHNPPVSKKKEASQDLPVTQVKNESNVAELQNMDLDIFLTPQTFMELTIEWLRLLPGTSVWNDKSIKFLFVDYAFFDVRGEEKDNLPLLRKPDIPKNRCFFDFTTSIRITRERANCLKNIQRRLRDTLIVFILKGESSELSGEKDDLGVANLMVKSFFRSTPGSPIMLTVKKIPDMTEVIGHLSIKIDISSKKSR